MVQLTLKLYSLCIFDDIIPLKNFERQNLIFSENKDYYILSYIPSVYPSNHTIRKIADNYITYNIYIYDNISNIKMDNLNHFTGYKESGQLKYRDSYYDIISKKSPYKIYYIVIQRDDSFRKTEYNITIVIYSTQTPLIVPDRCQTNFSVHSQNQTNYIFKIPENKYPAYFFGFLVFNGAFSVDFSIKENDGLK